jgi:hypothetical protein
MALQKYTINFGFYDQLFYKSLKNYNKTNLDYRLDTIVLKCFSILYI